MTVDIPHWNYMIDIFICLRLLNLILTRNFQKISVFSQKIDIYSRRKTIHKKGGELKEVTLLEKKELNSIMSETGAKIVSS